jgi:DNA-dependent RNA polymerase auxiliary subunit epsilon
MGMPTIPDIKPKIELSFEETIKLLLSSIALEELSLAHIMNAEAEKIQEVVKRTGGNKVDDLLCIDKSVERMMRDVIKKEMLLEFKFENILELLEDKHTDCEKHKECEKNKDCDKHKDCEK